MTYVKQGTLTHWNFTHQQQLINQVNYLSSSLARFRDVVEHFECFDSAFYTSFTCAFLLCNGDPLCYLTDFQTTVQQFLLFFSLLGMAFIP